MVSDKIIFDSDRLMRFLLEFQPHNFKYLGRKEATELEQEVIDKFARERSGKNASKWLNADAAYDTYSIADKVYCDEEKAYKYSLIYNIIVEKFIKEFVGIADIIDLYKPAYFGFEWMMHVEYKPKEKNFSSYRDHYIHQVRNLFEMFYMLDQFGYYDKCVDLYEKENTFLAKNMRKTVSDACQQNEICKVVDALLEDAGVRISEKAKEVEYRRYVYRYIIYASAIVTSLVHDIGYPMQYISRNLQWIGEFLPISNYFFERKTEWQKVISMLENSLLFQSYSANEITDGMEKGDHGAVSACLLLIKFYRSGTIYSLGPAERMVIENSALAIYEHTLQYKKQGHKNAKLYQNVFRRNPFSYLFRFCDDLQEWGRVYFDITMQSNFLVCKKCGMIATKTISKLARRSEKENVYYCCCENWAGLNANLFKYRRLAHVDTCKAIELSYIKKEDGKQRIHVKLDYSLLGLLQAAAYNPQFAQKRADGLRELKQMVYDENGFGWLYVDAFLTNNPISIKTEIMRQYLKMKGYDFQDENRNTDKAIERMLRLWKKGLSKPTNIINTIKIIKKQARFYVRMAEEVERIHNKNKEGDDVISYQEIAKEYANKIYNDFNVQNITIRKLILDCIFQAFLYVDLETFFANPTFVKKRYFEMGYRSDDIVNTVRTYIANDLYDQVRGQCRRGKKRWLPKAFYDYYSDYYFFASLYKVLT